MRGKKDTRIVSITSKNFPNSVTYFMCFWYLVQNYPKKSKIPNYCYVKHHMGSLRFKNRFAKGNYYKYAPNKSSFFCRIPKAFKFFFFLVD